MPLNPAETHEPLEQWVQRLKAVANEVYGEGSERASACHASVDACIEAHQRGRQRSQVYMQNLLWTRLRTGFPEVITHISQIVDGNAEGS